MSAQSPYAPPKANLETDPGIAEIEALDVSETWKKRFRAMQKAGGPSLPIIADPVRLEQVLTHLLFAAVKYTPSGGRVRVGTEIESGPTVRLDDMDLPDGIRLMRRVRGVEGVRGGLRSSSQLSRPRLSDTS